MINDSKTERTSEQHDITQEEFDAAYEDVLKLLESKKMSLKNTEMMTI